MIFLTLFCFLVTSVCLFWFMLQLFFSSEKALDQRMDYYLDVKADRTSRNEVKIEGPRFSQLRTAKETFQKKILSKEKNDKLETKLTRAGLPLKPGEYVLFQWILTAFLGGIFYLVTGNAVFIFIGALLGFLFPKWYLRKKIKARIAKFNEGLGDMITTIVGSLRAGFSFPQALQSVVEEASSPIKEEMDVVLKEMQYGKNLEDTLNDLKGRMPSEDLDLMIQAILIQRQVGGNLATVLDKIVQTIRDRTKIHRQISTLTAQGRLSGYVIALLPVILGFVLYVIQPKYIGTLFHNPIGIAMLAAGVISGIIGFIMIKKITNIEV